MGKQKHTYEFVKQFLLERNIELLEKEYKSNKQKLECKCGKCGHVWNPRFNNVKDSDRGCPACVGVAKHTYEEVKQICIEKRIEVLEEYSGVYTKMKCKCMKCSYTWEPTFSSIKNKNYGCPKCYGNAKFTHEEVNKFLFERDIELLESEYKNSWTKMKCRCMKCDNVWYPRFDDIKNKGVGCSFCNKPGKSQKQLFEIIKELYSKTEYELYYNYKGIDWLVSFKGRKMESDIFIANKQTGKKIIIEYDGEQHFIGGTGYYKNKLETIQQRDRLKDNLISEHPDEIQHFIRIPYWETITKENIKRILQEAGAL